MRREIPPVRGAWVVAAAPPLHEVGVEPLERQLGQVEREDGVRHHA